MPFSRESIRFPLTRHIWVPRSGRRAAGAGISLYSPCSPPVVFAQRALFAAVRLLGPRILPGARASWDDPIEPEVWAAFVDDWRDVCGPWDSAALYRRPQSGRSGCSLLLLREGRGVGFVRIATERERALREYSVMRDVHAARPTTFAVAKPLGWGTREGWAWVATESVPNYPLGAVRRESVRLAVAEELGAILDDVLPRSADVPVGWRGSHGDFAPWNLRTEWGGAVRVIDWEDAGFAPPGVDLLYGGLTAHLTFGTHPPAATNPQAAEWLANVLRGRRAEGETDDSVNNRLLAALAKVRAG